MNREELKKILPYREPMLLLDEAYMDGNGKAIGVYRVRGDEYFLQGHYPNNPLVPGSIQCEIMAQTSCILFKEIDTGKIPILIGLNNVKFKNSIKPKDQINIEVEIIRQIGLIFCLRGELIVDGKICMSGEFLGTFIDNLKKGNTN